MRLRAALLALLALLLTACAGPASSAPEVSVSGEPGSKPILTYVAPLDPGRTYRSTIWPGTGPELHDGEPVLLNYWVENARTATVVAESYSASPVTRELTPAALGADLYRTLSGAHIGARLLQVSPPGTGAGNDVPTVTVVDVLSLRATGQHVDPPQGLPTVKLAADGAPTLTPTGTDPPTSLVAQPLIRGSGRQVTRSDTVTVQYVGFSWKTGEAFDSTWSRGSPSSFSLVDVPAWAEGLADQPVGSQLLLVVPPTYALGATQSQELSGQTVVFVVDILAVAAGGSS
ncbi:FKBP-type peptidyl-prolyl cis-trans isomerase [Cellulomonas sp. SG140]|uniref:FKBP-type peptidyl-prolyl cis-trans isomerase n=1 Tax=Cellulomonas sp. SG140 TaxID=2976536 RepID=UPI0021E74572|nr:FKBP-type peptidyl-prolyl cis-trans isomerase [Cellulomonas sp. SG140]